MKFIKKLPKLLRLMILLIILLALILIALSFIWGKINGLIEPTPNMISRFESTGRDATCADLIGKWLILGEATTWEFRENGTFVVEGLFIDEYRMESRYTCNDSTRKAEIPFCGPGASGCTVFCCTTTRLGRISDDRMVIDTGVASRVHVIERK